MAYRATPIINFPIGDFRNVSAKFLHRNFYDGKDWGLHLGVDFRSHHGTKVFAIGRGTVVYSKLHAGELSVEGNIIQRNWGGIVIVAHKNPTTKEKFYSLYGHLGKRFVKKGDYVEMGDIIGSVGKSLSESNGMWDEEHLHFGIYSGPFHLKVLPGYYKESSDMTRTEYWHDPIEFINAYKPLTRIN